MSEENLRSFFTKGYWDFSRGTALRAPTDFISPFKWLCVLPTNPETHKPVYENPPESPFSKGSLGELKNEPIVIILPAKAGIHSFLINSFWIPVPPIFMEDKFHGNDSKRMQKIIGFNTIPQSPIRIPQSGIRTLFLQRLSYQPLGRLHQSINIFRKPRLHVKSYLWLCAGRPY